MNNLFTFLILFLPLFGFAQKDANLSPVASEKKIIVTVKGMVCSFCAQGIEKKLKAFKEVKSVNVDLDEKKVFLDLQPGLELSEDQLKKIIKDAGFDVVSIEKKGAS
jgi:copper chaperone CopZ